MRFRVLLPVSFGFLAIVLMIWDVHNQGVIESMGMGWDTGAPVWPYQASSLLLHAINAPAFAVALPFFLLPHLQMESARFPVVLPVILLWWWWLGTRIDYGILGRRRYGRPRLFAIFLAVASVVLLYAGGRIIADGFSWWSNYRPVHPLILASTAGLALWAFALACGCMLAARRLLQGTYVATSDRGRQRRVLPYGVALVTLVAIATSLIEMAREDKIDPNSCVASTDFGCVHGTIADADGTPVKGIEVELLPAAKVGEARWASRKSEWTDSKGRYNVTGLDPGEYFVAVHYYDAPDMRHPFSTTFYPGAETEQDALRITAKPMLPVTLNQLRLRSLPLVTIQVKVQWPNGTPPKWSNLDFHNQSYPSQAVVGDVAPAVEDGRAEFTLPEGFAYAARASVRCDAGAVIESRESRPVQQIRTEKGLTPRELTFTIPGPPCRLWTSR